MCDTLRAAAGRGHRRLGPVRALPLTPGHLTNIGYCPDVQSFD
jgi:hypothetical protein